MAQLTYMSDLMQTLQPMYQRVSYSAMQTNGDRQESMRSVMWPPLSTSIYYDEIIQIVVLSGLQLVTDLALLCRLIHRVIMSMYMRYDLTHS